MPRIQVEKKKPKRPDEETPELVVKKPDKLIDDMDALLDEIDGVLEENAEEFVKNFVQKSGE